MTDGMKPCVFCGTRTFDVWGTSKTTFPICQDCYQIQPREALQEELAKAIDAKS